MVSLTALVLLVVILVLICTGCIPSTETEYDGVSNAPMMMTIVDCTTGYTIYKHDETGVHYFCRDGGYGKAVCIMVNADGTPYTGNTEE